MIQLTKDTTIEQFNASWEELKPQVIGLVNTTVETKFNESWETLKPTIVELSETTTSNKFDAKWEELKPTLETTVNTLVETAISTFKGQMWQLVTQDDDFPFLLPENFGAVGDGETDDTEAIQNCFDKAMENHKSIMLSSMYGYYISSDITSSSNFNTTNVFGVKTALLFKKGVKCTFNNISFYDVTFMYFEGSSDNVITLGEYNESNMYFIDCDFYNVVGSIKIDELNKKIIYEGCEFINTWFQISLTESIEGGIIMDSCSATIDEHTYFDNTFTHNAFFSGTKDMIGFLQIKDSRFTSLCMSGGDGSMLGFHKFISSVPSIRILNCSIESLGSGLIDIGYYLTGTVITIYETTINGINKDKYNISDLIMVNTSMAHIKVNISNSWMYSENACNIIGGSGDSYGGIITINNTYNGVLEKLDEQNTNMSLLKIHQALSENDVTYYPWENKWVYDSTTQTYTRESNDLVEVKQYLTLGNLNIIDKEETFPIATLLNNDYTSGYTIINQEITPSVYLSSNNYRYLIGGRITSFTSSTINNTLRIMQNEDTFTHESVDFNLMIKYTFKKSS